MPIYEYQCVVCGNQYEQLIRSSRDSTPPCSSCGSDNVARIVSAFAVDSQSTRQMTLASARRKALQVERDKNDADHQEMLHHHQH